MKEYCVYVLSDPRKPEESIYGDVWFGPERPFYVGMGRIWRPLQHRSEARQSTRSSLKLNTIRKILEVYENYTITYVGVGLTREEALHLEQSYIAKIGRADLKLGPLSNLTDGGDGGVGMRYTAENCARKSRCARRMHANRSGRKKARIYAKSGASLREFHSSLTPEERKIHYKASIKGKAESIKRKHAEYLRVLFSAMAYADAYLTYNEIHNLTPSIPKCTLTRLLREYTSDGLLITEQKGARYSKRYFYA